MKRKGKVRWAFRLIGDEKNKLKVGEVVDKPLTATVVSIVENRVVLEFTAEKIQGEGISGGKIWADGIKIIFHREELDFEVKDKIVVDESNDFATIIKAKAVGARGIVTGGDKIIPGLPTVRLSTQQLELFKKLGAESSKIWLNGVSGKIFIT